MLPLLAELAEWDLSDEDAVIEDSDAYQKLLDRMDACMKDWIKKAGKYRKPFADAVLSIVNEQDGEIVKEAFMYGFSLGMLVSMEENRNGEIACTQGEGAPNPALCGGESKNFFRLPYVQLLRRGIGDKRVDDACAPPQGVRFFNPMKREEDYLADLALRLEVDSEDAYALETQAFAIAEEMLLMKGRSRFNAGYDLGIATATQVLDYRALFLKKLEESTATCAP